MFKFTDPQYLYLLLIIPLCVGVYLWSLWLTRRRLRRLGDKRMLLALMPGHSSARQHAKFVLAMLALAGIAVVVARPQYGVKQVSDTANGIEAVVMVDVSNSMLANDVQPSRLDRAKLLVTNMVDKMKNDKIALGVFAGEAYPQLPITSDYASAKMFIDALSPEMVTMQGTNLAAAIELGCRSFSSAKNVGKAIIVITDGENHEGGAEEAAKEASKEGVNVYVIGVGSTAGSTIPTSDGVLTDRDGNVVRTALNEQMCRNVALAGKGIYLHLDQSNSAQEELQQQLRNLKQGTSTTTYTARNDQFQAVSLIVIFLLVAEVCLLETKNPRWRRFKLFKK